MHGSDSIELTVFSKDAGVLTKRIRLGADGKVASDSTECRMARGTAQRVRLAGVEQLAELISNLRSDQAIGLGAIRSDLPDIVAITTKKQLNGEPVGVIARTGSDITYAKDSPSFVLLDFDTKGMPSRVADKIAAVGGYWNALVGVLPELGNAAHVIRKSTSAGLRRTDTGEQITGSGGVHAYIAIKDGTDAERFLDTLHDRCWLAGLGWMLVSESGQLLQRSIVDRMVGGPERLVFEGPPVVEPPLAQDPEQRKPRFILGTIVDSIDACPPLSSDEQQTLRKLIGEESRRLEPEKKRARDAFVANQIERRMREGLSEEAARRIVELAYEGTLLPDFELILEDGMTITAGEVLADPRRFEGCKLADPVEGVEFDPRIAMIMIDRDGAPFIHSFAHGKAMYWLRHDAVEDGSEDAARRAEQIARNIEIGNDVKEPIFPTIMTLAEMQERLVFIGGSGAVVDRATGRIRKKEHAHAEYAASIHRYVNRAGEPKEVPALKFWIGSRQRVTVDTLTWVPGSPQICSPPESIDGARTAFNSWRGLAPMSAPEDWKSRARPFFEHVEFLVPVKDERERFLQWLAHIIQRPEVLPHTSYLMMTPTTGVGRNLLASIIVRTLRGHVAAGVSLPDLLDGGFTGRLSRKLLAIVDEAREGSGERRFQRAERVKSIITEEHRQINPKYGHQSIEKNCCRWLMFSNHSDAIPFDNSDRRIVCIENPTERKQPEYYENLFRLLDDIAFVGSVRRSLETLDISSFKPGAHAPDNAAKRHALFAMMSETERAVLEFKEECETDLTTRTEIREYVRCRIDGDVNENHLTHAIKRAGMISTAKRVKKDAQSRVRYSVVIVKGDWTPEIVRETADEVLAKAVPFPPMGVS